MVGIVGDEGTPAADTWLEITAVWRGRVDEGEFERLPVLELVSATPIEEPSQPYE